MKFTLRQLEFYIALAETSQVSKAASRCHVSQSSMTVALRNLEETLNAQLFLRQPKGIRLTSAGERFLSHARKILHDSQFALEDLLNQPETTAGILRIGIAETLSAYLLPEILSELENRFPLMDLHFQEAQAPELLSALSAQQVDFCLLLTSNIPQDGKLEVETFIRSLRQLWTSAGHPLLSKPEITLGDVAQIPFLMLTTDEYPVVIDRHFKKQGYEPDIRFRSNSFEAIRSLVAQGKGVTILSDLVYRPWALSGLRITRRTITDCITSMDVGVVKTVGHPLSPASLRVLDVLRQQILRLHSHSH
jgi:DNA-binding transcriptional LysR family regulator